MQPLKLTNRLGWAALALLLILSMALPGLSARAAWQSKIDPLVLQQAEAGPVEALIYLAEQADLRPAARLQTKAEKGAYVYQKLSEVAARTQPGVIQALQRGGVEYRPFWIANMLWARLDQETLEQIAARLDVARIYANPQVALDLPQPAAAPQPDSASGIEWNIAKVRAPEVWAAGFTGQGAVIAGQDTGYQWDHPALINQYRGWDGLAADHNYNWHDAIHTGESACPPDSPVPCDDHGHGTHTMGTMLGDDGLGNQVGMAPGARWIACRNMLNGIGTPATYTECFEWFAAPTDLAGNNPRPDLAPDVINNSWTCPPSEGCSWDALQPVVENTRAAGILVVASAGNNGYNGCETVNDPPALYGAAFTVGATTSSDGLAGFSSRGPADYNGLMKPDISAPGEGVRSSVPGGYSTFSGTSMAGPHVAGLAALLVSWDASLRGQVDQLEHLMRISAVHLPAPSPCSEPFAGQVPNNSFGFGRIDALLAITVQQWYWPLIYKGD